MRWVTILVTLLLPCIASAQEGRCTVHGANIDLDEVVVRVPGEAPLSLSVRGVDVTAHPRAGMHEVMVRAGLLFSGVSASPVFSLARPVETAFGLVRLSTSAQLSRVRSLGDGASVTAELGRLVRIPGLAIPCDALTLESPPEAAPGPAAPEGDGTYWVPRERSLIVRLRPGAGPGIRLRARIPAVVRMVRTEVRQDHFRLVWVMATGSRITGWVARTSVRPWTNHGWGSTGGSGRPGCMPGGRRAGTGLYAGPATIRPGAEVHTRPNGPTWAAFRSSDPVPVYYVRGETWVQVRAAPGVTDRGRCAQLSRAWVRRADVTLPIERPTDANTTDADTSNATAPASDAERPPDEDR